MKSFKINDCTNVRLLQIQIIHAKYNVQMIYGEILILTLPSQI